MSVVFIFMFFILEAKELLKFKGRLKKLEIINHKSSRKLKSSPPAAGVCCVGAGVATGS